MAGRPTKLTPQVQDIICNKIEACCTDAAACEAVNIHQSTFIGWMNRGEAELERVATSDDGRVKVRGDEALYVEFFKAVTRARARAIETAAQAIASAITGMQSVEVEAETLTETRYRKDGTPYEFRRERTKKRQTEHPPDWRAAVEFLKRRDRKHWSDKIEHQIEGRIDIVAHYATAADEFNRLIGEEIKQQQAD